MGLFSKNRYSMKKQLQQNVARNLSSCRTCMYFDRSRGVCVNPKSGAQYVSEVTPRCSYWQVR